MGFFFSSRLTIEVGDKVEEFGKDLGVVRLGWCLGCWIDCARVYIGLLSSC
ncbi:hypothetical protein LOAG_11048 [Loa loa]|uniref:Uncharacterized protein n=1 Tax=Loa loa TaxID=7209 RepID=A0A1S0TNL3_LOALO|nr:hypothetical protein LOAG_11048 [Loa loa]EFO17452.2 hypothetical protein LOAG_11048 [Loa loa]